MERKYKDILNKIEEEKAPYQEIIKILETFINLKDSYETLKEDVKEAENKEMYEEVQSELNLATKDLIFLSQKIAKFFKETKKETELYSFDEAEKKLKELSKKQFELKRQMDSN